MNANVSRRWILTRGPVARETFIAAIVTSLALTAMAVDHLLGDDPGLEDPPAFLIAAAVSLIAAGLLFGRYLPRVKSSAQPSERAARPSLIFGLLAVPSVATSAAGLTFIVGGGAIAFGLLAREGSHRRRGTAAMVAGTVIVLFITGYYGGQAIDKLFG